MAGVEGRIALVTGAGRGIGRETAELLTSRGAEVMAPSVPRIPSSWVLMMRCQRVR